MTPPAKESSPALPTPPCALPSLAQWFREEVQPHDAHLKSFLRGRYPTVRDIDDVVQESYLRVWKARTLHPIDSAKAFLFKVAQHLALNTIRKEINSRIEAGGDLAASRVLDTGPDASQALITKEILALLAEAISALPEHYRAALVLHKFKGLSHKEVAEQLELSPRTVEKYCLKGINRCEEYLNERGIAGYFR